MKPSPEKDMSTACECSRRWIATGEEPKASGHYSDCKEFPAPQPAQDAGEWAIYDGDGLTWGTLEYVKERHPDAIGISTPQPPFAWGRTGIIVIPQDGKLEEARQMAAQIVADHRSAAAVPRLVAALKAAREQVCVVTWEGTTPNKRQAEALVVQIDEALTTVQGKEQRWG